MHGSKQDAALGGVTTGVSVTFCFQKQDGMDRGPGYDGHGAALCERLWELCWILCERGKGPMAYVSYVPYT
jgi:hypothetical protein